MQAVKFSTFKFSIKFIRRILNFFLFLTSSQSNLIQHIMCKSIIVEWCTHEEAENYILTTHPRLQHKIVQCMLGSREDKTQDHDAVSLDE